MTRPVAISTSSAPTGTSPASKAFRASFKARSMYSSGFRRPRSEKGSDGPPFTVRLASNSIAHPIRSTLPAADAGRKREEDIGQRSPFQNQNPSSPPARALPVQAGEDLI